LYKGKQLQYGKSISNRVKWAKQSPFGLKRDKGDMMVSEIVEIETPYGYIDVKAKSGKRESYVYDRNKHILLLKKALLFHKNEVERHTKIHQHFFAQLEHLMKGGN
jgi:hypothetical protein